MPVTCSLLLAVKAVHLALLRLLALPQPLLPQWGGKLAGKPADLLSLRSETAAYYKVANSFVFICDFAILLQ